VKWSKDAMEDIFENNKVDLPKAAKNLTMQTWDIEERKRRSLDGKKNNRFPQAPVKQAATPRKVKAILGMYSRHSILIFLNKILGCFLLTVLFTGAVKAFMLHSGDTEGPAMKHTLASCRKAIGQKMSMDAFKC
jgi:hypothetical protein